MYFISNGSHYLRIPIEGNSLMFLFDFMYLSLNIIEITGRVLKNETHYIIPIRTPVADTIQIANHAIDFINSKIQLCQK